MEDATESENSQMTDEKYIRVGFYKDFKGEDSILISADIHGLLELESTFLRLSEKNNSLEMNHLKLVDKEHRLTIKLNAVELDEGCRKINEKYEWNLTPKKWSEFREKTTALYRNGMKGHQYLDSNSDNNDDLQVVLSLNEYDKDFWKNLIDKNKKNVWQQRI